MDPVSIIVAALVAGASDAVKKNATQAITEAYQSLKAMIVARWKSSAKEGQQTAKEAEANVLLEQLQEDPDTFKPIIEKKLAAVIPEPEGEVLEKAKAFHTLLKEAGLASGTYQVNISDSKGVQVGDNNSQTNKF